MINGIKPIIKPKPKITIKTELLKVDTNNNFDAAVCVLIENIHRCYENWNNKTKYAGLSNRTIDISTKVGSKFIKIVRENSVWGFVARVDGTHKGLPLKKGDVLKAAGWSQPAKHTRGNIFDDNQDYFDWTGPNYL